MKIPYSWLKEFVPVSLAPARLAEKLTMAGFEVEGIESVGGDTVLDIAVMPNRGDCLSMMGMAREVAAITNGKLKSVGVALGGRPHKMGNRTGLPLQVRVLAKKDCPRYTAALVDSIRVAPSPSWMRKRLEAAGLRSINNIVDLTNYVMLETGQPLHAFDAAKISGGQVIVRRAKPGETLKALDEQTYKLGAQDLVIADAVGPIAIAGVIGGMDSSVSESTRSIILESAFFVPSLVRKTSRQLGIRTDSSYRFERTVNEETVLASLHRALALLPDLSEGKNQLMDLVDEREKKPKPLRLSLSREKVCAFTGASYKDQQITQPLKNLGFQLKGGAGRWQVTVPSHRGDVKEWSDLIEEICRLNGYDSVPTTLPRLKALGSQPTPVQSLEKELRHLLTARGLHESVHVSFVSEELLKAVDASWLESTVRVDNPIHQEMACLRPALFPQLIQAAILNQNYQQKTVRLFEVGKVFTREKGVTERRKVAGLLQGTRMPWDRTRSGEQSDFFELKGLVSSLLQLAGQDASVTFVPSQKPFLRQGRAASVMGGGSELAFFGALQPSLASALGLRGEATIFELDVEALSALQQKTHASVGRRFQEINRFPCVERDVCFVAGKNLSSDQIVQMLMDPALPIVSVHLFDLYEGKSLGEGKRSLGYRIKYQKKDGTLTDEEVTEAHEGLIGRVRQNLGVELRALNNLREEA